MKRKNIEKSRFLRRNQTQAEKKLWSILRNRQLQGIKFRRQFPLGRFIIDFYSPELRLGIEADGGEHYEDESKIRDEMREKEMTRLGIEIIRIPNNEIMANIEGVGEFIQRKIGERKRHHHELLSEERGKILRDVLQAHSPSSSPQRGEEKK